MMNLRSNNVSSKTRGAKRKKDDQENFATPQKPPRKKQETRQFGFYEFFADNTTSFVDDKGNQVKLKTSMLVNSDNLIIESPKKKLIPQLLKNECKTIDTFSPLKQIFYSQNGSPVSGITQSGTRMSVRDRLGLVTVLDNRNPTTPEKSPKLKKDFENNSIVKGIVSPPADAKKTVSYTVTSQKLGKVEKAKRKNKKRIISQKQVMVRPGHSAKEGSVNAYADACLERTPKKPARKKMDEDVLHWCHLEAHSFGGDSTQNKENLAAGPSNLNGTQIIVDGQTRRLVKKHKYPKVENKISVSVKKGTHIATGLLEQEVKTNSFETLYQLPTTKKHKPLLVTRDYVTKTIDAIVTADKITSPQKTPKKDSCILTFSKFSNKKIPDNSSKNTFKSARQLKF